MQLRADALSAAAEWMTRVEALANRLPNLVATIGQIDVEPGGVNVIAGLARCSLDVRHAENSARQTVVRAMLDEAHAIGRRRGVAVEAETYHEEPAVKLDEELVTLTEHAVRQAGYSTMRMTSGAGHDAMVMARHVPSAMIFLRNPGGISHHPDENVAEDDVAAGLRAGIGFMQLFGTWLDSRTKTEREPEGA